jgi:hypothetical protein
VENVLDRLRRARPHLAGRIDRAAGILVMQLASAPRTRPVRVRTNGRKARFLVESQTSPGVVYEVSPRDWSCTCRDFFERGLACKHGLASYTLTKATVPPPRETSEDGAQGDEDEGAGCDACEGGWVHKAEEVVDQETGEVTSAHPGPEYMDADELLEWMGSARWRYARTMPKHPHDYSLREWNSEETFLRVVRTIWLYGYDRPYLNRLWRSLDIGDEHYVWVCTVPEPGRRAPLETTQLINRAERLQTELIERGGA